MCGGVRERAASPDPKSCASGASPWATGASQCATGASQCASGASQSASGAPPPRRDLRRREPGVKLRGHES